MYTYTIAHKPAAVKSFWEEKAEISPEPVRTLFAVSSDRARGCTPRRCAMHSAPGARVPCLPRSGSMLPPGARGAALGGTVLLGRVRAAHAPFTSVRPSKAVAVRRLLSTTPWLGLTVPVCSAFRVCDRPAVGREIPARACHPTPLACNVGTADDHSSKQKNAHRPEQPVSIAIPQCCQNRMTALAAMHSAQRKRV